MDSTRKERLRGLKPYLNSLILGQEDAMTSISDVLLGAESNLNIRGPHQPPASLLFMGPTGVGKTESTKQFTNYLFGEHQLSMVFMNQMKSADQVPVFIQAIRRAVAAHPQGTTVLLDEIEKAHMDVIDILLSLLEEGQATGPNGEYISIANCYVVLTSNIGSEFWGDMQNTLYSRMHEFACDMAKAKLRTELFYRITKAVVFRPLSLDTQIEILKKRLTEKLAHLACTQNLGALSLDEKNVHAHLLRKCFSDKGGARLLKQLLDEEINFAVSPWILGENHPVEGRFYCNLRLDRLELR